MKNIWVIVTILLCGNAAAEQIYLNHAANAWATVLDTGGTGGAIAAKMNDIHASDVAAFRDLVSIIAYNDTAMTLYQTTHHIEMANKIMTQPMSSRRNQCLKNMDDCAQRNRNTVQIDGTVFASTVDYSANKNSDFNTRNTGGTVRARTFITDAIAMNVAYTRTVTDTHGNRVYTDATSNGITLGAQYMGRNGLFINSVIGAGHTSWNSDKTIAGIYDPGAYDTDFISGQINFGINMERGRFAIIPQAAVRYIRATTDKHVDAAAQAFEKWWYNTLNTYGGVRLAYDFVGDDFLVRPYLEMGAGYDAISHGPDAVQVRVLSGQTFDMPIDAPARFVFDGGAGLGLYTGYFYVGLNYELNIRSDYMAHTGKLNLKIQF